MGFSEHNGHFILPSNGNVSHVYGMSKWSLASGVWRGLDNTDKRLYNKREVSQRGRMQSCMKGWIAICAGGAVCQLALVTDGLAADARSPGQGNPLDTLPKLEAAPAQPVVTDIQAPSQNPAMQRLLASRITPSRFRIAGVESLPFETVAAEFAPLTNREITIAELLQAAANVTRLYQEKGYPLSFAFVPDQTFKDNIVVVNVVEGYVNDIKIQGNAGASAPRLRKIAEQLKTDRPLSQKSFDRITGILGLQPGMRIKATVRPPTTTDGAAEMVLDVKRTPIAAAVGLDTATSDLRGVLNVSANALSPLGEQISASTLAPRGPSREEYYSVNYVQPIRYQGMLLQINLSHYEAEPKNRELVPQQFEERYQTETQRISANLSYPLILTQTRSLSINGGIYAVKNESRYTRSVPAVEPVVELRSDIRALSLELTSLEAVNKGSLQWTAGIFQGFDAAGAKQVNSDVDLDFTRIKGSVVWNRQLTDTYGFALSGMGQYSGDTLALSEQIGFGGKLFGLAYPAGEIAGDRGWGISAEINRSYARDGAYIKQIQPYILADAARVYLSEGELSHDQIASVGFGVRFSDTKHYSLDLSIAQPVGEIPVNASRRAPRLNFSYAYQFE